MSDFDWGEVLAIATGQAPSEEAGKPAGPPSRLAAARGRALSAVNRARFELTFGVARAKHRWLRRHTFVESHLLDLDLGCVQYRGLRCLVCDAPSGF